MYSFLTGRTRGILVLLTALATFGCSSPVHRAEAIAHDGALEALVLPGVGFMHRAFAATRGREDLLVVFIDGDGSPWVDQGRHIASDPTPRAPLALELAVRTPDSVLYLGRPCYFRVQARNGPGACDEKYWTSDRYSAAVVASMVAAATGYLQKHQFGRALLVGYSGGGTLAVLMAREMPQVRGVVTIAGNLDPETWTRVHGYLPLTGSLNPSLEPPLPAGVREWHLIGERDRNVPYAAAEPYLRRVPADHVSRYAYFDHACCWKRQWPEVFGRIRAELDEHMTAIRLRNATDRPAD